MPKESSVASRIFNFAVFIFLEIAAILMLSHNGQIQRLWIARISHGFMAKTWGATQNVRGYLSLKKQNDELAEENSELWARVRNCEEALRAAGDSAARHADDGFTYIPATIVKSSWASQHNYLILNKGSEDGVTQDSGVVTSEGVVGIVDAVSKHYSYALSFLNTEVNISARLGDEGAVGPMCWDGQRTDGAILREIPLQYKFEPGDTVYTSGYSNIFPAGIPLGVTGETKIINGATNEIRIRLFHDQKVQKYVTIVKNTRASEIEELEKAGEGTDKK